MKNYREQVLAALQATVFHSSTTYSWFGKRSQHLPRSVKRALTPETARGFLLFALQSQLYNDFYCQGFPRPTRQRNLTPLTSGQTPFIKTLSDMNQGSGYWTAGWEVREVNDRAVVVHKRGLALRVQPEECLVAGSGSLAPGNMVSLRFAKEFLAISPGFYMALGNQELVQEDGQTVVRWYWNLTPFGAVRFMRIATQRLNHSHISFKLKVLNDPTRFSRCDSVVLYTSKKNYDAVSQILAEVYPEIATDINPGIPVFTKSLASGVGLAEDPGHGESFGLHRCGLLGEGMVHASEQGKKSLEERLEEVENSFAAAGIGLGKPFLNPGSKDDYGFPLDQKHRTSGAQVSSTPRTESDAQSFLQTATEIGNRLSREAIWCQGRCNWLSVDHGGHISGSATTRISCSALGPDLYAGTCGIALFLAELYSATGDAGAYDAALGAVRQALSDVDSVPPLIRFGFFTGWSGLAFTAARVGVLLGEEELLEGSRELLQRLARENQGEREFDLLSGLAGAVAALVVLGEILDEAWLLEFAARLGDELLATSHKSQYGCSWSSVSFPSKPHLTGLSHGAAGIGYALLELFHASGDPKYRCAAELAFGYERQWFDEKIGNWPDFRTVPDQGRRLRSQLSFASLWCHGAPGIALSRLRAYQLLNEELYKGEALAALQTTSETVAAGLQASTGSYCLCHGLAGNADILLHSFQALGRAQEKALALEVANAGIERYGRKGREWPCGPGGETPSLMIGLAGIGYFYLRLYKPTLPSILILQRESFL